MPDEKPEPESPELAEAFDSAPFEITHPEGEELIEGYCRNCGFRQKRPPEELEPESVCPNCGEEQFGGPGEETDEEEGDDA